MQTKTTSRATNVRSSLILMLTTVIWGLAFVAQRSGMEFVGPFLFMGIRMLLGALTLGIILLLMYLFTQKRGLSRRERFQTVPPQGQDSTTAHPSPTQNHPTSNVKSLLIAGFTCGCVLFIAGSSQQIGLVFTTASKAGFLTALYIVLVPILGLIIRHKTHWNTWLSVTIAAVGLYFLCIKESFTMEIGDLAVLVGAFFWACHILVIDHFVVGLKQRDLLKLCALQFLVAAALALVAAPILDGFFAQGSFDLSALVDALPAILYTGILSTGVAFTLQAVGQQGLNPSAASIIMSLEAVFSLIFGMLLLGEMLAVREAIGCALMFAAVILSQMPVKESKRVT